MVPAGLVPTPHGARRRYVGKNATALAIAALAVAGCGSEDTVVTQPNDASAETTQSDTGGFDTSADTHVEDTFAADVQDEGGSFPIYK
jgi:hypothetical protein